MRRTFTVHMLIVVVLVCPYLCLGASTNDRAGQTSTVGCSCCDTPPTSNDNSKPRAPDRGDSDCLCRGAILDIAKVETGLGQSNSLVTMLLLASSEGSEASCHTAYDFSRACHFPPGSNGRDVCALTCSLLL